MRRVGIVDNLQREREMRAADTVGSGNEKAGNL